MDLSNNQSLLYYKQISTTIPQTKRERETGRETERERQRRQTDRLTDRQRQRDRNRDRERERDRDTERAAWYSQLSRSTSKRDRQQSTVQTPLF